MEASTFTFTSEADGARLTVHSWSPAGAVRGIVQVIHGMGEHGLRYARVAQRLTAAGFRVVAADHRGHGASVLEGRRLGDMGPDAIARAAHDAATLARRLEREHPGVPRLIYAQSMGTFITQRLLGEEPGLHRAVALSGSSGPPPLLAQAGRVVARLERLRVGAGEPSALLHAMSFGEFAKQFRPLRTPADWLSRDPAEVDRYVADPLCGFTCSTQTWVSLLDTLPEIFGLPWLRRLAPDVPVWVLAGDQDPVGESGRGPRKLAELLREAGVRDVTLTLYPGARHEPLNETNRDDVERELLAFYERALGPR